MFSEKSQYANSHPDSCFHSLTMSMPRGEQSLSIKALPPLIMSIFSPTHGQRECFVHSLNIAKHSQLLCVQAAPFLPAVPKLLFWQSNSFKRIFQNFEASNRPAPAAAATTTTVTSPCSFPCSSNLPAGYVKCFHMKHILVKSVECPVNVPN